MDQAERARASGEESLNILRNYGLRRLAVAAAAMAAVLGSGAAMAADEQELFNGKDFTGWTFFLEEKGYNADRRGRISDFATVTPERTIRITPSMHGALMTERDYLNYELHAEFRWVDPHPRDDSGIFLRIRPPFVWDMVHGEQARFYMVQVQPPNTGDLWVLGYNESLLKTSPDRAYKPFGDLELAPGGHIRRHLKMAEAEKPAGQWNSIDIRLKDKEVEVRLNGLLVNQATMLVDLPGRIGLESERGTIEYRNIRLSPL